MCRGVGFGSACPVNSAVELCVMDVPVDVSGPNHLPLTGARAEDMRSHSGCVDSDVTVSLRYA